MSYGSQQIKQCRHFNFSYTHPYFMIVGQVIGFPYVPQRRLIGYVAIPLSENDCCLLVTQCKSIAHWGTAA